MMPFQHIIIICLVMAFGFMPVSAHADWLTNCTGNPQISGMVVTGIVTCVDNTIYNATASFLSKFSLMLRPFAIALAILAVMIFGMRMVLGERHIGNRAFGTIIRIALVLTYSMNLGGLAAVPFTIVTAMVNVVAGGPPWMQMDASINALFGFGPNLSLYNGMLGILGASLFSSSTGIFFFFISFAVILSLMYLMLRAIYTYLLAVLMISFMILISPLVILSAMFATTERYFRQWVNLLFAAILQPVLLFAFLNMFFGLVINMVASIFAVLGGNDFSRFWHTNSPMFSWAMITDPSLMQAYQQRGMPEGTPIEQAYMNPLLHSTTETNFFQPTMFDLGLSPHGMATWQDLIGQFLGLGVVCFIMTALVDIIPEIADGIASVSTNIGFERLPLVGDIAKALKGAGGGGG